MTLTSYYILLTLTLVHCQNETCYRTSLYAVYDGYRVGDSHLSESTCIGREAACCAGKCLNVEACVSAGMKVDTGLCRLFHASLSGGNVTLIQNQLWRYMEPRSDVVKWDDWVLVFRGIADIQVSVYRTWLNDTIYHDHPVSPATVQPGCVSSETSLPCSAHFRSKILSTWATSGIELVKFLLLKNSNIVAEILFNGTNTNNTSWFAPLQVINSTWTDLTTSSFNFFSIEGQPDNRRFFINNEYSSCSTDINWMTVIDERSSSNHCAQDTPSTIPKFLYSSLNTKSSIGTLANFDYADVMAVLVKQSP